MEKDMTTIDAPPAANMATATHQSTIKRLFSFRGRFNRIQYIGIHFAWFFVAWFGWFVLSAGGMALVRAFSHELPNLKGGLVVVLAIAWLVACVWVYFATLAKRFHDFDWSGASCLLVFIPVVGLFFVIALMFIGGTVGPNRYGPPPARVDG
jgi:uncharacterized membrane protein YhaH (DUF805 family)